MEVPPPPLPPPSSEEPGEREAELPRPEEGTEVQEEAKEVEEQTPTKKKEQKPRTPAKQTSLRALFWGSGNKGETGCSELVLKTPQKERE